VSFFVTACDAGRFFFGAFFLGFGETSTESTVLKD